MNTRNLKSITRILLASVLIESAGAQIATQFLEEKQKLIASDGQTYQHSFGQKVAMSDGMIAISAYDDQMGENAGAVYIYLLDDGSGDWTFQQKILPQPIAGQSDAAQFLFGFSGLEMEGDTLVIGARGYGTGAQFERFGALYFYERQGDNWIFKSRIAGTTNRRIGNQLALDGDRLVTTGSPGVHVYERSAGSWSYVAQLTPNEEPGGAYGNSVAIDGATIIVTDRARMSGGEFAAGGAFVFERDPNSGAWLYSQTLVASDLGAYTNDQFGNGCAVRGDTLAIGTGAVNRFPGRVIHLFKRAGSGLWQEDTILTPSMFDNTDIRGDQQYFDIAISENERVIAAAIPDQHYGGNFDDPGAVLFYEKVGNQWRGTARIGASDASSWEDFGWSIAVDGDSIAVGNIKEDLPGTPEYDWFSAVYVFSSSLADKPEAEVDRFLRAQLYYEVAGTENCCSPEDAAFRWKTLLYEGSGSGLHSAPEKIGDYFSDVERDAALSIRATVVDLLAGNPSSEIYRDLLLDIDADLLAAEAIAARVELVNIDRDRLLRIGVPPLDLVLDHEIADYEAAIPPMRAALANYLQLWTDDLGVTGDGDPLGYTIFVERLAHRDLMPALYVDGAGDLQPVGGSSDALQTGYRDAAMLFELFADLGETAASLAHLYWLQNTTASLQSARDLIGETSRFLFVQGNTLRGTFPGTPSVLEAPLAAWNAALAALAKVEADIDGDLNPLGFDENFYVLFNVPQGGNDGLFDTFNILRERLDDRDSNSNQIVRATDAQQAAIDAYEAFVGGQQEIEGRLTDLTRDAKLRLLAIVGAEYDSEAYNNSPAPNTGEDGGFINGSELWQQFRNIERARLQIEKNGTQMSNLREAVAIEAERNAFETETQNAIGQINIRYANRRADIQEQIGNWNAAQAFAEGIAGALNPTSWGDVIGNAITGGVNTGAEIAKGQLEAQKERIAGFEQAEIIGKNNEILNANSAAKIKTMMLDMGVLVLNSQENSILLQQELARLTALFRERAALERRIVQHESNLSRRYFADPIHQLRYLNQFHIAEQKFAEAQQTIYFAARALEYKWNQPFASIMSGTGYTLDTIFQVRNASELQLVVDAMEQEDADLDTPSNSPATFTDVFSLRDDAFGFDDSPEGIAAFREFLRARLSGDLGSDPFVQIALEFSTVRDPLRGFEGDNFFRGPRLVYAQNGTASVLQKGNYLDKIKTLQITMPGAHTVGPNSVSGSLVYGGTGFIRRKQPGDYNGPRRDRVADELVAFPTRVASSESGIWSSADTLTATVSIALGGTPSGLPIDQFRERSVATNGWELSIVVKDNNSLRLDIDEIDDIKLHFTHQLLSRQ